MRGERGEEGEREGGGILLPGTSLHECEKGRVERERGRGRLSGLDKCEGRKGKEREGGEEGGRGKKGNGRMC